MQEFHPCRRGFLAAAVFLIFGTAAGLFCGAVVPARASGQAAISTVQQLIDGLVQIMKAGPATPFPQRYATLEPVIDKTFDLAVILQESIGPGWSGLPPDQQILLTEAFKRYTVASYVNNFDNFNGQQFQVAPETRAVGKGQVVETKVVPLKGDTHELDYVMRDGGGGWRVVDVLADGSISRVAVQRSDFRRLLARGGPQALADSLRAKSVDLSDGAS